MGYCSSKQQTQTFRSSVKATRPEKGFVSQSPPSLIIEMSNGSIQNIPIRTSLQSNLMITSYVQPGIFFGSLNQIYLIVQSERIDDNRLLQAAHTYYLNTISKETGLIEPECAYLIRAENRIFFIVKSRPLGNEGIKFVDLVQLGIKMKEKQIQWQDLQFNEIITQVCRKYTKLDRTEHGINNVVIGSDGSIKLLGYFTQENTSNEQNVNSLKKLFLRALYGCKDIDKQNLSQLQKKSYFSHKNSLTKIEDLKGSMRRERQNKYTPIQNPGLKFIRDYITAYYYKLYAYNQKIVDTLIALKQPEYTKKIINEYVEVTHINQSITVEWYSILEKYLKIEKLYESNSSQTIEARNKLCSAGYFLAQKFKQNNQYAKSYKYFRECLMNRYERLEIKFYIGFYEVCKALNKSVESENIIMAGLKEYPSAKILHLLLIIHMCDCMKIEEAQKQLMKANSYFRTLQMEISTSKILLTKAIMNPSKKMDFVRKSKQQLSKVILEKYGQETDDSHSNLIIPIYHQIKGDTHLQELNFQTAEEQYHISKLLLKNQKACGFKLANAAAAQANCMMLKGSYESAITVYNEALSYINEQCRNLMDSIIGNRAISKIRKGESSQGRKQIEQILDSTPKEIIEKDYNYIFLQNILKSYKP